MADELPSVEIPKESEQPKNEREDGDSVLADRLAFEHSVEHEDAILHAEASTELEATQATHVHSASAASSARSLRAEKDEVVIEVEKILEDGIGPFFASLPEEAKPVFKKRGEEVASKIAAMVRSLHLQVRKAVRLISSWLKTIPGVNRYFLEQETKIKIDRIQALIDARKDEAERT